MTDTYRLQPGHAEQTQKHFDFLKDKHGFAHTLYNSSSRFTKSSKSLDEEIVIRSVDHSVFLVEHSRIRKSPLGRKVQSQSVRGDLNTCVAYVSQLHPNA